MIRLLSQVTIYVVRGTRESLTSLPPCGFTEFLAEYLTKIIDESVV